MKRFLEFMRSLKSRLILLVALCTIIPAVLTAAGMLGFYENKAISNRESQMKGQAKLVADQIARSDYLQGGTESSSEIVAKLNLLATLYEGRVIIVNQNYRIYMDTYNIDTRKTIISEEVMEAFLGESVTSYDSKYQYIEITIPIVDPEDSTGQVMGVMLISSSTDNIIANYAFIKQMGIIVLVIACTLVLFVAVLMIIYLLKPIHRLNRQIVQAKDNLNEGSFEVEDYTETIEICRSLNEMIAHMKVMDESRQEFVSNVSHELKTPLTSMKVLADSINSMPDAPVEMYREFMGDITGEIERETSIINDLLSLVKMDRSAADLNVTSVNVNELLEQILKRLQPIADRQQVELVLESFRPVTAELDVVKITLAFTNLVENAIKYNKNDGTGWVHVTLNADHQFFYLKVEDSGMGIPEESLDHIYERFYRVDKSHSREIGGTGLGLAITRSSILMHRGAIKAHSILGEGTTFDVRIPLTYIS